MKPFHLLFFFFPNSRAHWGKMNSIFISEMCRGSSKPTNQSACNCLTNWVLTFHGFWFDRFLDKSYYIRSALKLTALLRQIQYISQAAANCLIPSWKSFYWCGSGTVVHCGNHSDQNTSIHTFKLVVNVKESSSACMIVDLRLDLGILLINDILTDGMSIHYCKMGQSTKTLAGLFLILVFYSLKCDGPALHCRTTSWQQQ